MQQPQNVPGGQPTAAVAFIQGEREPEPLQASPAWLAEVLAIAEDAIISVNETQHVQIFNQGAEKIFGYSAEEVLGKPLSILLPTRFRAIHIQHMLDFAQAPEVARIMGKRREIFGRRRDGEEFPAEASISKLERHGDIVFTVILRDITERKRGEAVRAQLAALIEAERSRTAAELEQQVQSRTAHLNSLLAFSRELLGMHSLEAVLREALHHASDVLPEAQCGVIYLVQGDDQRLVVRASYGFTKLPAISIPHDVGLVGLAHTSRQTQRTNSRAEWEALVAMSGDEQTRPVGDLDSIEAPFTGAIALPLVVQQQAVGVLVLLRQGDEGSFAVEEQATLEGIANLTATAVLEEQRQHMAARMSTQLANLEAQRHSMEARLSEAESGMLQAARLAAVGQLAASIAHEINNPLYAARNALYLLEEDLPEELRSGPYLTMASEQLARIARIIERMRDFYRPTRGEVGRCNINQLLEDTLALAELNVPQGRMAMVFVPANDLRPIMGNADQLRQVFLNIVLNAIDAMPEGGTLTVRTEAGPTVALIEIQDTGIGIPEELRERLFEPFFTNKPNGTGLGLSISAHIVTQHGGQIEVESMVGRGTTFRIVLPYGGAGT
ncbi:MAG: PAS domain S-box protein [Herpetosiphonaceae bacterium]|nr:PAS domain S-box protein [Herpetosiphonaceae bacterium]